MPWMRRLGSGECACVTDEAEDPSFFAAGVGEFDEEFSAFLGGGDVLGEAAFEGGDIFLGAGGEGEEEEEGD